MDPLTAKTIRRLALDIMCAVAQYQEVPQDLWNELYPSISKLLRLCVGKPVLSETVVSPEAQRADEVRSLLGRNADLAKQLKEAREELAAANHDRGVLAQQVLHAQRVAGAKEEPVLVEPEEKEKIHAAAVAQLESLNRSVRPLPEAAYAEPPPREAFAEAPEFARAREYIRTLIRIPGYELRLREAVRCSPEMLKTWANTSRPMPRALVGIAESLMHEHCNGFATNKEGTN